MAQISRQQLDELIAKGAAAGIDSTRVVNGLIARGHQIEGQAPERLPGPPTPFGYGEIDPSAAIGTGVAGVGALGLAAAAKAFGQSRTTRALAEHGASEFGKGEGLVGSLTRLGQKVGIARRQPKGFGPLGASVGAVPPSQLPPVEPFAPRAPFPEATPNFGGQPLSTAPSVSQSFATEVPATVTPAQPFGAEPISSRSITVEGRPGARAPIPTTEPRYTGGRGKSPGRIAEEQAQRRRVAAGEPLFGKPPSAPTPEIEAAARKLEIVPPGDKQPAFGKNGHVIGELGDEARVAGRAATSFEDLVARAASIARKVPKSARPAVFQTVKAASKFAHESDHVFGAAMRDILGSIAPVPLPGTPADTPEDELRNALEQFLQVKRYKPAAYEKAAEAIRR